MLQIDLAAPTPVYEQIAGGLRALLVEGAYSPGDQLPTVRQIAMDLGVHHNTVAEAYRLLAEEGWLDLKRGRGATVLNRQNPKANREVEAQLFRRIEELAAKAVAEGIPRAALARHLDSLAARFRRGGEK
jgi:DNA-binding transcriptional regulator YhcF (GntR family)